MKKPICSTVLIVAALVLLIGFGNRSDDTSFYSEPLESYTIAMADSLMTVPPATVTCFIAERSEGGIHDFYSEGDYWWPDSLNPGGPYVKRDGESNPDNFVEHRHAMIRFADIVATLTSAYLFTGDKKYVPTVMRHVNAWFVDDATKMNPSLLYAQAIKGIASGRSIGIIDTIHLMEVVQSLIRLENDGVIKSDKLRPVKDWFAKYLGWMTTHPYGTREMNASNNHGTCWAMQAALFAKFTGNKEIMALCTDRFKNIFLVDQMASDGSFPREMARTKPYGYSLFNLDAMAILCEILSDKDENLWEYTTSDGKKYGQGNQFYVAIYH